MIFLLFVIALTIFNIGLTAANRSSSAVFHTLLGFLPFFFTLPAGLGLHSFFFLFLGCYYHTVKTRTDIVADEKTSSIIVGFFGFFGTFYYFFMITSLFELYLIIEIMFVLGVLLIGGNRSQMFRIDYFFFVNIFLGLILGIGMAFISIYMGNSSLEIFSAFNKSITQETFTWPKHFLTMLLLAGLALKFYIFPGQYTIESLYDALSSTQVIIFSTIFTLPYFLIFFVCSSGFSHIYHNGMFLFTLLGVIWSVYNLFRERRIRLIIAYLTILTHNVLIMCLACAEPLSFTNFLGMILMFYLLYLMSVTPFFMILAETKAAHVLDARMSYILHNMYRSFMFYAVWLALAGYPLSMMYMYKVPLALEYMGFYAFSVALILYLVISFYVYVVVILFFTVTKEVYRAQWRSLDYFLLRHPIVNITIDYFIWTMTINTYFFFVATLVGVVF